MRRSEKERRGREAAGSRANLGSLETMLDGGFPEEAGRRLATEVDGFTSAGLRRRRTEDGCKMGRWGERKERVRCRKMGMISCVGVGLDCSRDVQVGVVVDDGRLKGSLDLFGQRLRLRDVIVSWVGLSRPSRELFHWRMGDIVTFVQHVSIYVGMTFACRW